LRFERAAQAERPGHGDDGEHQNVDAADGPLFTMHGPPTATWHRLMLPLADDQGDGARVLVGMVPMTHDGRPVALRI
jgi:hypothetical protein